MTAKLILIVEDNDKNLKLMRDLLQLHGYETIEATSAEQGIELAQSRAPALILMDIQLPGMNGIQALERIRKSREIAQIPVIAVTASVMKHDRHKLLESGFNNCIEKPIAIGSFLESVRNSLPDTRE